MTSNLGASEANVMGFAKDDGMNEGKAIKSFFAPEFRNRLDATVSFDALSLEVVTKVVSKFISDLCAQIADKKVDIVISARARKELAVLGYDKTMGARPLARVISKKIKTPLTDEILFGKLKNGGSVKIDFIKKEFKFKFKELA